jgi:UDP-glucose 4-epimerase
MGLHLISGGAGFVGVNLARRLLADGESVLAVDDLSRGRRELLAEFDSNPNFAFSRVDCSNADALLAAIEDAGEPVGHLWHMAANSDIPAGVADPRIDLERTFLTTFGVLRAMRQAGIPELHFASSSAIYGDFGDVEIHEEIGPLEPISNYGAMKLASEAQIRAAVEAYLPRADIFRFPNVIGVPATHGVIWDFIRKLKLTPNRLDVLGDGTQQKAYLHIDDLIDAMLHVSRLKGRYKVFNIGPTDEGVTVRMIAETVRDRVSPAATIAYGKDNRGWVGDVPRFRYSVRKLTATGWAPKLGSAAAMRRAVAEIALQEIGA